ncbi:cysteine hydrolase family protein [Amphibacillus marinus]|nr:cysteine hydrolase family protein [Amphibacillus marinus]
MKEQNKALIIIDVQKAFNDPSWGERNNPEAEANIKRLLKVWRVKGWEVIHIQHKSDSEHSRFYKHGAGFAFKEMVQPINGEKVIEKKVNSAFIGTDLKAYLDKRMIKTVIIVGLTTPHCVSTTTRMSGNFGYDTYLLSDATAAFALKDHTSNDVDAEAVHHVSLTTLHNEFATVLTTKQLLALL